MIPEIPTRGASLRLPAVEYPKEPSMKSLPLPPFYPSIPHREQSLPKKDAMADGSSVGEDASVPSLYGGESPTETTLRVGVVGKDASQAVDDEDDEVIALFSCAGRASVVSNATTNLFTESLCELEMDPVDTASWMDPPTVPATPPPSSPTASSKEISSPSSPSVFTQAQQNGSDLENSVSLHSKTVPRGRSGSNDLADMQETLPRTSNSLPRSIGLGIVPALHCPVTSKFAGKLKESVGKLLHVEERRAPWLTEADNESGKFNLEQYLDAAGL